MSGGIAGLAAALADRYRIERELGAGGMATVYLAQDLKHDRQVAIKVLKPELAAVLGAERFVQEITTTAQLQHPHILPLFDSGSADGFLYYVMPYVEGETLRDKLNRETQLGIEEAVKITTEVADALDYAHRHGVIHRDIKPENILLHDGRPIVADFGIALAVSAAAGGRMTETGLSLGTPHYMSPEQATAEKDLTNRSDIYSLGSVLYEMLTGSPPHTGASVQQIIMKIVTEDAAPVTSMRKSVPANVAAAVAMALEKLPADRFESARAFAEALGNRGFAVAEIPRAGVAAPLVPRSRTTTLALAGLATSALALAAWGWLRPRAEPRVRDSWRVALPVPDSIGISGSPSLSSDGTTIAYVGGDSRVWILRADGSPATPIAGTEGAYAASIAPDGARVAFLRNGGLELVPVAGGPPTRISDSTQFSEPAAWIDNSTLAFATLRGLMTISTSGGPITPLTTLDHDSRGMWHVHPEALPGGRGVIFSIQPGDLRDASLSRIAVVGPDGGVPTVLMPGLWASYAEPGHLLVTQANGSIVAVPFDLNSLRVTGEPVSIVSGLPIGLNAISGNFSVAPTGRLAYVTGKEFTKTDLVRVRRDGTSIPIDTSRTGNFTSVAASPDGRWVAGTIEAGSPDELRLRDLTTGAQVRITLPSTWLRMPAFLPDGRSLVFTGIGPQQSGLYRVRAGDAAAPELLFSTGRDAWPYWPSASADGQTIFYTLRSAGHRKVFAHHLGDSAAADRDIFETRDHVSQAVSSPDGRWLAYLTDESGRTELSVRPANLARAERWQVPRPAGAGTGDPTSPRWSRDSREIVYRSGNRMVSARVAPGPSFAVTEQHVLFPAPDYEPSFDLFPNGDLLMIRKRPATGTQLQLIMVDRWNSGIR